MSPLCLILATDLQNAYKWKFLIQTSVYRLQIVECLLGHQLWCLLEPNLVGKRVCFILWLASVILVLLVDKTIGLITAGLKSLPSSCESQVQKSNPSASTNPFIRTCTATLVLSHNLICLNTLFSIFVFVCFRHLRLYPETDKKWCCLNAL